MMVEFAAVCLKEYRELMQGCWLWRSLCLAVGVVQLGVEIGMANFHEVDLLSSLMERSAKLVLQEFADSEAEGGRYGI